MLELLSLYRMKGEKMFRKFLIVLLILFFGCQSKAQIADDKSILHGVRIFSNFNLKKFEGFKKDSENNNYVTYKKELNDEYDRIFVEVDKKTNKVMVVRVSKMNVLDLMGEAKRMLKKLEAKYGYFTCKNTTLPQSFFQTIDCISKKAFNKASNSYHVYLSVLNNPAGIGGFSNSIVIEIKSDSYSKRN